jgi:hypothetical protein
MIETAIRPDQNGRGGSIRALFNPENIEDCAALREGGTARRIFHEVF